MTTTRHTLILAVLLVAAGSLIFATGAAVIDGPNGDYARLNEGEIIVDVSPTNPYLSAYFEGVNVGSTGRISNVFTITNTANETADVWIKHGGENVTFVTDGDSIEGEANASELDPNGSVSVGFQFDTHGAEPNTQLGAEEFAIHVIDPDSDPGSSSTAGQQSAGGDDEDPETAPSVTVSRPSPSKRSLKATGLGSDDTVGFETDRVRIDQTNVTLDYIELSLLRLQTTSMRFLS